MDTMMNGNYPGLRLSRRSVLATAAVAAVTGRGSLTARAQTPAPGDPLPVAATFSVLGDLVQSVGGDAIDLTTVVAAGVDAHTFEATPADAIALSEARAVFAIGLDFEPWLAQLAEGSDAPYPLVELGAPLDLISVDEGEHGDEAAEEDGNGDGHGEHDPHVWQDVGNVIEMTKEIARVLSEADPGNAAYYAANAAAAVEQLQSLDAWIVEQVATLPEDRRVLVTAHDTFGYFARRYGFEVIGSIQGLSTAEGEPSAMELAELSDVIASTGITVVFPETMNNAALVEAVVAEAGVTLGPPLYTDSLGPDGSDGATYDGMMRHNVEAIVGALGG